MAAWGERREQSTKKSSLKGNMNKFMNAAKRIKNISKAFAIKPERSEEAKSE